MSHPTDPHHGLPVDLTGQTVLDIGCGSGASAREAARRGASEVVALDIDDEHLATARGRRGPGGALIDYRCGDVEVGLPSGPFDHVLCHNLLHRVRNPIDVLDRMIEVVGKTLILEVTGLGAERPQRLLRRDYGVDRTFGDDLAAMPLVLIGRNGTPHRKREQKFFFSPAATRNLLMEQRRYFASLDVVATESSERYLMRAERRTVGHLIVVSGPTGSGKSTLLQCLSEDDPATRSLAAALRMDRLAVYRLANGGSLGELLADQPGVLFHYDLLRPWRRDARVHERDEALHVIDGCRRLTVVTLVARPSVMRRRLADELAGLVDPDSRAARRLRDVIRLYADPVRVAARVARWLEFCDERKADMHLVDTTAGYRSIERSEWRSVVEAG